MAERHKRFLFGAGSVLFPGLIFWVAYSVPDILFYSLPFAVQTLMALIVAGSFIAFAICLVFGPVKWPNSADPDDGSRQ